jgi:hypothetical protein
MLLLFQKGTSGLRPGFCLGPAASGMHRSTGRSGESHHTTNVSSGSAYLTYGTAIIVAVEEKWFGLDKPNIPQGAGQEEKVEKHIEPS